jgi:tRNA pseudouridine55 synthase
MMILTKKNLDRFAEWNDGLVEDGGMVLIDKEREWTSFDAVAKMRSSFKIKKVGHAGTLDPLASGLLILCVGRKATRLADSYQGLSKQYWSQIRVGAVTETFDMESEPKDFKDISGIDNQTIIDAIMSFEGEIEQAPPAHSAIKVDGVRAYKLARASEQVEMKKRAITIHKIGEINIDLPFVDFLVDCSKGSYIRSLADDIGKKIGVGAYLSGLRRTAIGEFRVEDALTVEEVRALKNNLEASRQ